MPETILLEEQLRSWFGSRRIEALRTLENYLLNSKQDYYAAHDANRISILPYVRSSAARTGWTSSFDEQSAALRLLANIGEKSDHDYLRHFFEEKVASCSQGVDLDPDGAFTDTLYWTEHAYPNSTGPISTMLFYCDGKRAEVQSGIAGYVYLETYPKNEPAHKIRTELLEMLQERM